MSYRNAKVYPNGKFSLYSLRPYKPPTFIPASVEGVLGKEVCLWLLSGNILASLQGESDEWTVYMVQDWFPSTRTWYLFLKEEKKRMSQAKLGLSTLLKNKVRAKRGSKGITREGRRKVENGAGLIQEKFGKQNLTFFTGTIPDITEEEWERVADRWPVIMNRFLMSVKYHLRKEGLEDYYVGCYEIQEERFENYGVYGLHCHFIFVGRVKGKWLLTVQQWEDLWRLSVGKELTYSYEWSASTRVEKVARSAAGYLGKYLSKGLATARMLQSKGRERIIPAWYACSRLVCRWVAKATLSGVHVAEWLGNLITSNDKLVIYVRPVFIAFPDESQVKIGEYGRIRFNNFSEPVPDDPLVRAA